MVELVPFSEKHLVLRLNWLNQPEVNRYYGANPGIKIDKEINDEWYQNYLNSNDKQYYTILFNKKPIGIIGLNNISKKNQNADITILLGESEYRGKGCAKSALQQLIDYGFYELELHKLNLGVFKDNQNAINLFNSVGFIIEGDFKDEVFFNNEFHDFLSMALFKSEYKLLK